MITTRARLGRSSVIVFHLIEELAEIAGGEAAGGALEPLHGPAPEVEVERAGAVLDRPPQRPPVHPGQPAEQPGAGDPARPGATQIGPDERGQPLSWPGGLGR